MSDLVIVESPAKAKTIQKYLGPGYEVIASMGHVRDLPKSKMGVDKDNDFKPQYTDMKGKEDVIKELKKRAKKCDKVYLATDPDREGEAISWHIAQMLKLDMNDDNRVAFNEITKTGVKNGMSHPHKIDVDLVNAQQARRILDRLVGYELSPFLWKKVKRGLSAGRVQSVAVRLVVDRENEIRAFVPKEYWSIDAKFTAPSSRKVFDAALVAVDSEKLEIPNQAEADDLLARLENAEYTVKSVKKRVTKKQPAPPFITSTLQQEASRKLSFSAKRTMKAAQELYEGVDVQGVGAVGLITYMRTDSLRISDEAKAAAAEYIGVVYGKDYLPPEPRNFKTKNNAQDAHEAIRPSTPELTPERVKSSLSSDQYKLYKLIWERFIASQMANALLDTVSADIEANGCTFRASGYSVKFDGFMALYVESNDSEEGSKKMLPELKADDKLKLKSIAGNQHFTQPPPRYTEASLIKALEENGIGRPSTYAPTITTITSRRYVEHEGKALKPTNLGEVITELMKDHFKKIVDAKFTAEMENNLDEVEHGTKNWVSTLHEFYDDFSETLKKAEEAMDGKRVKVPDEETDVVCELCGRNMVIKYSKYGKFLACPGFPDCKNTKKIVTETDGSCPRCGKKMLLKKSKKGRSFYGCEGFPDCNFMTWNVPTKEICPQCGKSLFMKGGKSGKLVCENEGCGYERELKK
ncbi:type I DNA topoisomerase [Ruminococcus flavefaciens]|uniref:type I DNA topoisomerase n=1 Tax=Ruminococcus flavefaciens TaxID=1265 RepID=UPI0026F32763|nr:type I DNA topoisomerase [Ruminococcus flavefaciens]MDD7516227.1 type I DNA topoisomerase [Ruminococcus flavefaciens]MDY5692475.1 type I DNA topoisomerase [Ruminococcus flavefaciens]